MLQIDFIRENPNSVRKNLERRQDSKNLNTLDVLIKADENWRKNKSDLDKLRAEKNTISKKIQEAKQKKQDVKALLTQAKELPAKIKVLEKQETEARQQSLDLIKTLPNLLHESVPFGKDDTANQVVRKEGQLPSFDFKLEHHGRLAERLNGADFETAAKISGAGFYYLKGDLALLEQAVLRFALDEVIKKGFTLVLPPLMMHRKPYEGVTDLQDFEKVMYKIEDQDAYLIATSEHPMAAMHMNQILKEKDLPLLYCGYTPCFRKEIGRHSVDERGLFRVRQFNKVEQFIFCKPEESWEWHEKLLKNAEHIMNQLEVPYRVVNVCTGDIGVVASKKYDIEGWSAREKKYIELISNSNCTSYQAAGLNIKYRTGQEKHYVHTLNSTAIATPRVLRVLLENNQTKAGTVKIPKALQPYLNGLTEIKSKQA